MRGQPLGVIERAGPSHEMLHQIVELRLECGIGFRGPVFLFQIEDQGHERFGDIAAAEGPEMPAFVGLIAERVGYGFRCRHGLSRLAERAGEVQRSDAARATEVQGRGILPETPLLLN